MTNTNNFKQISAEGEFSLWVDSPIYKSYTAGDDGYIRNTKTGENCGKQVILRKHYYEGTKRLKEPICDEDCYEFVFSEVTT